MQSQITRQIITIQAPDSIVYHIFTQHIEVIEEIDDAHCRIIFTSKATLEVNESGRSLRDRITSRMPQ